MATEFDPKKRWTKSQIFPLKGTSNYRYPDERLSPDRTEELSNINLTERGSARKRFGSSKYNSAQISEGGSVKSVNGLVQQEFKNGTTLQIETAGTKIYTNDGSTRTDVTGSVTVTDGADKRNRFAFIKDKLIATNGTNPTWTKAHSGNAAALGGTLWTTCEDVVVHQNLLFVLNTTEGGTHYPTRIRWCDVDITTFELDITVWPAGNRYAVFEDGAPIVGGVDAFGRLIVIKKDGIYPISVSVQQGFIEAYADNPLRGGFTPVAKNGIIYHPSFGIFLIAIDGAYIVKPDLTFQLITRDVQFDWNQLNPSRLQYAHSWIRENDHQIRTLVSSSDNSTGHDKVLVYDYETGDVWFDTPTDSQNYAAPYRISGAEFDFLGTYDGYVLKSNDSGELQDNGSDIPWTIRSVPNDLGSPGVDKEIGNIVTYYIDKSTAATVSLSVIRNEKRLPTRVGSFDVGATLFYNAGSAWNAGLTYGGNISQNVPFFVNRFAETIQPEWTGTRDFEPTGYQVEYREAE